MGRPCLSETIHMLVRDSILASRMLGTKPKKGEVILLATSGFFSPLLRERDSTHPILNPNSHINSYSDVIVILSNVKFYI